MLNFHRSPQNYKFMLTILGIAVLLSTVEAARLKWLMAYHLLLHAPSLQRLDFLRKGYPRFVCLRNDENVEESPNSGDFVSLCDDYIASEIIVCAYDCCFRYSQFDNDITVRDVCGLILYSVKIARSITELRSIVVAAKKMDLFAENTSQFRDAMRNRLLDLHADQNLSAHMLPGEELSSLDTSNNH